ncbi:MAG: hypothetical protein U0031_20980 [Thermomicrobiales bacterium]
MKEVWSRFVAIVVIISVAITAVGVVFTAKKVPWPGPEATAFIEAVAHLLGSVQWLLVVLVISLLFRNQIRSLLPRITQTKFLGNELTIAAEEVRESVSASALIERLSASEQRIDRAEARFITIEDRIDTVSSQSSIPVASDTSESVQPGVLPDDYFDSNPLRIREAIRLVAEGHSLTQSPTRASDPVSMAQNRILLAGVSSPIDALVLLTDSIREELYGIARDQGLPTDRRPAKVAEELAARNVLDQLTVDALKKFWAARAAAYHGSKIGGVLDPAHEELVLDTIDSGLVLLRVLGERRKELASGA